MVMRYFEELERSGYYYTLPSSKDVQKGTVIDANISSMVAPFHLHMPEPNGEPRYFPVIYVRGGTAIKISRIPDGYSVYVIEHGFNTEQPIEGYFDKQFNNQRNGEAVLLRSLGRTRVDAYVKGKRAKKGGDNG